MEFGAGALVWDPGVRDGGFGGGGGGHALIWADMVFVRGRWCFGRAWLLAYLLASFKGCSLTC